MAEKRALLSDRLVAQLPLAVGGPYKVRDTELSGFLVSVGRRRKSYTAQAEHWVNGVRTSKSIVIGHAGEITARDARGQARLLIAQVTRGEAISPPKRKLAALKAESGVTLRQAWSRYLTAHMERKNRSPATIRGYADHVERVLAEWLDLPLLALAENPIMVAERHDVLSEVSGPSAANGAMRTLRAIYNHARKSHRDLPAENPTLAVDWNSEKRRNTAMGLDDLPGWFVEARLMRHPVRREFHLFSLLSGSRPGALLEARIEHINFKDRVLHIPRPKGGADRAFDIPLSRPMVLCLVRAIRASRMLMPHNEQGWVFAGEGLEGRMVEHKENRKVLSKWGNDLRQTFRTMGQVAGLSEIDMHLLMNHSLPGVNAGYITRARLITGHLRTTQEKLTATMVDGAKLDPTRWPNIPSRLIGDNRRDPTLPDPRSNKSREARFWAVEAPRLLKTAMRAEATASPNLPAAPTPLPRPTLLPTPAALEDSAVAISPRARMLAKLESSRAVEGTSTDAEKALAYQTSRY